MVCSNGFSRQETAKAVTTNEISTFHLGSLYLERIVEVYNECLDRWEREAFGDLVAVVPFSHKFAVRFTHARQERFTNMHIGWFRIRLPGKAQNLWAMTAR